METVTKREGTLLRILEEERHRSDSLASGQCIHPGIVRQRRIVVVQIAAHRIPAFHGVPCSTQGFRRRHGPGKGSIAD